MKCSNRSGKCISSNLIKWGLHVKTIFKDGKAIRRIKVGQKWKCKDCGHISIHPIKMKGVDYIIPKKRNISVKDISEKDFKAWLKIITKFDLNLTAINDSSFIKGESQMKWSKGKSLKLVKNFMLRSSRYFRQHEYDEKYMLPPTDEQKQRYELEKQMVTELLTNYHFWFALWIYHKRFYSGLNPLIHKRLAKALKGKLDEKKLEHFIDEMEIVVQKSKNPAKSSKILLEFFQSNSMKRLKEYKSNKIVSFYERIKIAEHLKDIQ